MSNELQKVFVKPESRLYFRDDSPVIPVLFFFQPECRATPESGKLLFSSVLSAMILANRIICRFMN